MIRKLMVTTLLIGFFSVQAASQAIYAELSYQSFRPFVHFQLNLGSDRSYYRDSYQAAYLKGYMDGVNDAYYNDYRFYELVRDIDIYEAGYRDGFRDRGLLIRLRGRSWYHRHRFAYDAYHSPYYSVKIWLNGLTFAFLQAPRHRLPDRWRPHAHPQIRKYRRRMQKRKHYAHIEKRYRKHTRRLRKDAHRMRSRYRKQRGHQEYRTGAMQRVSALDRDQARRRVSQPRQRKNRYRSAPDNRSGNRNGRTIRKISRERNSGRQINKQSRVRGNRAAKSSRDTRVKRAGKQRQRKAVRSRNGRSSSRKAVRRSNTNKRQKNRGSVSRSRSSGGESRSRRSGRSRDGGRRGH